MWKVGRLWIFAGIFSLG
ncbi:KxYKxGKxW signal peptide domain-containing protein [Selenomonas ruminantium]